MKNPVLHAKLYVAVLALSVAALLYAVIHGGNPYHVGQGTTYDLSGKPTSVFHPGDWVYVKRDVCLDRNILSDQSPALYDIERNAYISLPVTTVLSLKGCAVRSSGIQLPPDLPTGDYEYRNVARYQNNLVGRDEATGFPPVRISVTV